MNRDVVCSLRNRASPFWAVKLTASNGIVFGNWLAANQTVRRCVLLIGSTSSPLRCRLMYEISGSAWDFKCTQTAPALQILYSDQSVLLGGHKGGPSIFWGGPVPPRAPPQDTPLVIVKLKVNFLQSSVVVTLVRSRVVFKLLNYVTDKIVRVALARMSV